MAIGLGLALCLAAGAFAATPLYLPGIALLFIAASAAIWVPLAARTVRVMRAMDGPAVEENAPLGLTVRVLRSGVPLPGAEVRAWPGGRALEPTDRRDGELTAKVSFARRGRHRLGPAAVMVSDPLGLSRRSAFSAADEVLVLPRVEPVRFEGVDGQAGLLGRERAGATEIGATEVDSLRPHRPGAPASRIHWPTVARTTMLMERRLVADGDERPLVVVDPREPSSEQALDQAVRAAASVCVHLARQGGCSLLLPGDRRATRIDRELYGFSALHARLALLQAGAASPPLGCLSGADTVLWVTAAARPAGVLAQLRTRVRYLVSPHPQAMWPVQFAVAGCAGQRLERGRGAKWMMTAERSVA